tara:strand:- start:1191 stop:2366 length:1176 start_codon:yes stop_codon:yes gene_type:complete
MSGDGKTRCTICLCMIVKNESNIIRNCLDSVLNTIDYWVICDTGSTDGTQDIIKEYFKEKGVKGELHEHKWENFGKNRSLAFYEARGKCDYVYVIDADDRLNGDILIYDNTYTHVNVKIDYSGLKFRRQQVFNNTYNWVYVGVLHEHPELKSSNVKINVLNLEGCHVNAGTFGNRSQDPEKYAKDAITLEDALKYEPNNSRYMYYLAQSYRDSKQYDKAVEKYKLRTKMGGNPEEVYYSYYMVGKLKMHLNKDFDTEILHDYLDAFNYRPSRLETLYEIMMYYRSLKKFKLAFGYGILGLDTDKTTDNMMVINDIYEWMYLDELGSCAICCGLSDIGVRCLNTLLNSPKYKVPDSQRGRIEANVKAVQNTKEKDPHEDCNEGVTNNHTHEQ